MKKLKVLLFIAMAAILLLITSFPASKAIKEERAIPNAAGIQKVDTQKYPTLDPHDLDQCDNN